MRKLIRAASRRLPLLVLAAATAWGAEARAQATPQGHASHHPGQNSNAAAGPSPSPAPTPNGMGATGGVSPGGMGGMGSMMEGMGAPPPKELYPSLMDLPDLTEERRAEVERLADERTREGAAAMSTAMEQLSGARARGDYPAMLEAARRMREAQAQFESGLAARRALAEGASPRGVALEWLRRDMGLPPVAAAAETPHGLFGLSWFHYVVMLTLAAFAAAMIWMYFRKMRRAEALLARLASGAAGATAAAPPAAAARESTPRPSSPPAPATAPANKMWSGGLRVARIFQETPDVKTFRLALPEGGDELPFTFEPGQFLTVGVEVDGQELKRSYSISSSPCCRGWCDITVKHARGGRVSGYLHGRVREGDPLKVTGPAGRFTFRGREAPSVVFIAGGVGITPLMSSIRYLTDQSWGGEIFLVYACATREDVIFREELEHLSRRHPNLRVTVTLSKDESPDWEGRRGHVTEELLLDLVPDVAARRVHLCGPPPMMEAVQKALAEIGVPAEQVRTEAFLSPEPRRAQAQPAAKPAPAGAAREAPLCTFSRSGKSAPLPPDRTVLEAAEGAGVDIDNSCRQGYCGLCKVRLLAGQVTMAVEDALDEGDRARGLILACQAKATADVTVEA